MIPDDILSYAIEALERLVAIPSVSAEGRSLPEAAALTEKLLRDLGFHTEQHPTGGAPVVYAERDGDGGDDRPTILFYNHYDVQPADPLELWDTEPFKLSQRDGKLYGRGASDDKGEIVSRLAALKWFEQEHGSLPFRAKFVIEGEEEIGSPNLSAYVEKYKDTLAADACIWEFGGVDAAGRPMTYCGLKGILTLELRVRTAGYDLHSSYGAVVENPIYRLSAAITSLRDKDGRILIEGFYDDVLAPSPAEAAILESLPQEEEALKEIFGVEGFIGGVTGTAFHKQLLFQPNININGFHSGYGGAGSKTVLPAEAFAKFDFRLVPKQDPYKILELFKAHLLKYGFDDIEVIVSEHAEHPARGTVTHPFVEATVNALREVYGQEPVLYPNVAGSGPMHPFFEHLNLPVVGLGCGYPGGRVHSPNEHIRLEDFKRGIEAVKRTLELYTLNE